MLDVAKMFCLGEMDGPSTTKAMILSSSGSIIGLAIRPMGPPAWTLRSVVPGSLVL